MEGQLWRRLYAVVMELGKGHCYKGKRFSDSWVVLTFLWAVLHDRPTCWACDRESWPEREWWHVIPSQSTMSRRLRTVGVLSLLARAEAGLRDLFPRGLSKWVDAKPLPVGGASKDRDARAGRCVKGKARGYKLHLVVDARSGMVDSWALAAMADNEKAVAPRLVPAAAAAGPFLYVTADNQYDANGTYDMVAAAAAHAPQLVARGRKAGKKKPKPQSPGHRRQSPRRLRGMALACGYDRPLNPLGRPGLPPTFGEQLLKDRNGIERVLGLMGNFGGGLAPLPNWVRTPHRVAAWVQGKILVFFTRELLKREKKKKDLRAA
jgi:hypothetical protein